MRALPGRRRDHSSSRDLPPGDRSSWGGRQRRQMHRGRLRPVRRLVQVPAMSPAAGQDDLLGLPRRRCPVRLPAVLFLLRAGPIQRAVFLPRADLRYRGDSPRQLRSRAQPQCSGDSPVPSRAAFRSAAGCRPESIPADCLRQCSRAALRNCQVEWTRSAAGHSPVPKGRTAGWPRRLPETVSQFLHQACLPTRPLVERPRRHWAAAPAGSSTAPARRLHRILLLRPRENLLRHRLRRDRRQIHHVPKDPLPATTPGSTTPR